MNRDEFQSKVVELWTKSQIPLTRENLEEFAPVAPRKLSSWLKAMVKEESLDKVGDLYDVPGLPRQPGTPRTCSEYKKKRAMVEEAKRRILARRQGKELTTIESNDDSREAKRETRNLSIASDETTSSDDNLSDDDGDGINVVDIVGKAAVFAGGKALVALDKPLSMLDRPDAKGKKSLIASGLLSLFGPVGWLYAGSFRETVPAILAFIAAAGVASFVPSFLLSPFIMIGSVLSGGVGLAYAWRFNQKRGRTPLYLKPRSKKRTPDS